MRFEKVCPACDGDLSTVPDELDLMCMADDAAKDRELDAKDGHRLKLKVAMDSGANIDNMAEDACAHIPVQPCTGPRRGKRLAAATGTPIETSGEQRIRGVTDFGDGIDWK